VAVDEDVVRHIASLARVGIDDTRATALVAELNGILAHMDVLQRVDTAAVRETSVGAAPGMPLREDGGAQTPLFRSRESFAPRTRDGFFLVPRLATHGALGAAADDEPTSP
jgi:aspartyl-tRNA(Asn)/glutamyl-tRNA(Gln) amidotransferase subunit C